MIKTDLLKELNNLSIEKLMEFAQLGFRFDIKCGKISAIYFPENWGINI